MPGPLPAFYLDEDIPPAAADVARGLGLDVVAAAEVGPVPRPDAEHLEEAAAAGRAVVTFNRNDSIEATRDAFALARPHRGVVILTRRLPRDPARVAHALQRFARDHGPLQPYEIQFVSGMRSRGPSGAGDRVRTDRSADV